MKERDLQIFLYNNPDVLFPGCHIKEKISEYNIAGRRIDLLFLVDEIKYVVELKAVPLERDHIGQVVEYYGLMREQFVNDRMKMILVAPSIPSYRRIFLEELGIRCVEIDCIPNTTEEKRTIQLASRKSSKKEQEDDQQLLAISSDEKMAYNHICSVVDTKALAFAQEILRYTLPKVQTCFKEYEVVPYRIRAAWSPDVDCKPDAKDSRKLIMRPGLMWWAYSFSEAINDVPNISVIAYPEGIHIAVNAEIKPSQHVFLQKVSRFSKQFDLLMKQHGNIILTTYLKLEHQPRFYHWIRLHQIEPGGFTAESIADIHEEHQRTFSALRRRWIERVTEQSGTLSRSQAIHMNERNKNLNMAFRLVRLIDRSDKLWNDNASGQKERIIDEVKRMKPMIDFFLRG